MEEAPTEVARSPRPDQVIARVRLAGEWNGVVDLECDHRQACRLATSFLRDEIPQM